MTEKLKIHRKTTLGKFMALFAIFTLVFAIGLTGCGKSDNSDDSAVNTITSNEVSVIAIDKAQSAAITHAGVENADFNKVELNTENGQKTYEVDFKSGEYKYDYVVDAISGNVISFTKEKDETSSKKETASKKPSKTESVKQEVVQTEPQQQESVSQPAANQSVTSKQTTAANSAELTQSKAKSKALKHAGVKSADANFIKVQRDYDDGRKIYEVDFRANGYEYDYEIDAVSGEVLKYDKEKDHDYVAPVTSKSEPKTEEISKSSAKKAALKHAGVKSADATFVKVLLDYDDGRKTYEVDFRANGYEYDYEIDAVSGEILKYDKERDEHYVPPVTSKTQSTNISKSAAQKAALKHAGVKEADAYAISVEYDNDDGVKLYEVEFRSGRYEYTYEISALDGSVISHEKDIDD